MLTATASSVTNAGGSGSGGTSSQISCTRDACKGTTAGRIAQLKMVQTLINRLAAISKMAYKPLVIDGAIGANTIALLQQMVSLYKIHSASPVVMDGVAANADAWFDVLSAAVLAATAMPAPYVDAGTSIPGVPPPPVSQTSPGAGVQVSAGSSAPAYTLPTGWAAWSTPQRALIIGGSGAAIIAAAVLFGKGKKSAHIEGLRGLLGLKTSRRRRR